MIRNARRDCPTSIRLGTSGAALLEPGMSTTGEVVKLVQVETAVPSPERSRARIMHSDNDKVRSLLPNIAARFREWTAIFEQRSVA